MNPAGLKSRGIALGLALFATAAFGQGVPLSVERTSEIAGEVPAIPGETARTPVIWGAMNAFDLSQRAWRTPRPAVTFDATYLEQRAREQQASLDRLRVRYAERMRATRMAGSRPSGDADASVGAGKSAPPEGASGSD
jgi:hypothetical protein